MKHESFSDMEYRYRKKKTKRKEFLEIMDKIKPWSKCWFNLSDEGVEDAIYDSYAMRKLMGSTFLNRMSQIPPYCYTSGICWRRKGMANCFSMQSTAVWNVRVR